MRVITPCQRLQRGLTLVELMISMVIGLLLSAAFTSCWLAFVRHYQQQQQLNRLADEAMMVSGFLGRELRRAGFWQAGVALIHEPLANPFSPLSADDGGRCLRYRYDLNGDGRLQGGDPATAPWHAPATSSAGNENFAIRLRGRALQLSRDGGACSGGGWETLTTPGVEVMPLDAEPVFAIRWPPLPAGSGWQLAQPQVSIALLLRDEQEPGLQRPLRLQVEVRNGVWRHD